VLLDDNTQTELTMWRQLGACGIQHAAHLLVHVVPLPVSGTREGDTNIAPPPSIVDPDVTERSRVIGYPAIAAIRAAIGV
jgi:hypothetical protein